MVICNTMYFSDKITEAYKIQQFPKSHNEQVEFNSFSFFQDFIFLEEMVEARIASVLGRYPLHVNGLVQPKFLLVENCSTTNQSRVMEGWGDCIDFKQDKNEVCCIY